MSKQAMIQEMKATSARAIAAGMDRDAVAAMELAIMIAIDPELVAQAVKMNSGGLV